MRISLLKFHPFEDLVNFRAFAFACFNNFHKLPCLVNKFKSKVKAEKRVEKARISRVHERIRHIRTW